MAIKTYDNEARKNAICSRVGEILDNIKYGTDMKIEIEAHVGEVVKIRYDITENIREDKFDNGHN